jgi:hypothetical protein
MRPYLRRSVEFVDHILQIRLQIQNRSMNFEHLLQEAGPLIGNVYQLIVVEVVYSIDTTRLFLQHLAHCSTTFNVRWRQHGRGFSSW